MKEDFLHFVWQYQYFISNHHLRTTQGQNIEVLSPGHLNQNSGADFQMARLKIDNIEWNGSVELHIKSSDWHRHQHQEDTAYQNVILHVVWQHDREVTHPDESPIPTLVLKERVPQDLTKRYQKWLEGQNTILCEKQLHNVGQLQHLMMLDKALTQRLAHKAETLLKIYSDNNKNWEETTYQWLGRCFGFKVNTEAFAELTKRLPLKYLQKHRDNSTQLEALVFGQAGYLNDTMPDEYTQSLQREYQFLKHKYQLEAMPSVMWKRARLRPSNFPTVRLAQFSAMILHLPNLYNWLTQTPVNKIQVSFKVLPSSYWQQHYDFDKPSKRVLKGLGKSAIENLLINTVVPLLAARAKQESNQLYMNRALELLEILPAENNYIINEWGALGLKVKSAFDSQALIELYRQFCEKRQCLKCHIGRELLNIKKKE